MARELWEWGNHEAPFRCAFALLSAAEGLERSAEDEALHAAGSTAADLSPRLRQCLHGNALCRL
ncbi:hypothetical protein BHS09_02435 [Myxococcus xanthus]|uniref:Uncharacterized protein n=1 Tax=Myxococcus xanthus TaxID=34 RepID=A0AAE6KQD0_MYXXA|nr:hypothetical protein BHS09_02435 [Myxococcus xanthus]QDE73222.1 hypothetical protein BHS08_02435 [Myxococcus xanthus]